MSNSPSRTLTKSEEKALAAFREKLNEETLADEVNKSIGLFGGLY
jgi:hypothetical protein